MTDDTKPPRPPFNWVPPNLRNDGNGPPDPVIVAVEAIKGGARDQLATNAHRDGVKARGDAYGAVSNVLAWIDGCTVEMQTAITDRDELLERYYGPRRWKQVRDLMEDHPGGWAAVADQLRKEPTAYGPMYTARPSRRYGLAGWVAGWRAEVTTWLGDRITPDRHAQKRNGDQIAGQIDRVERKLAERDEWVRGVKFTEPVQPIGSTRPVQPADVERARVELRRQLDAIQSMGRLGEQPPQVTPADQVAAALEPLSLNQQRRALRMLDDLPGPEGHAAVQLGRDWAKAHGLDPSAGNRDPGRR